MNYLALFAIGFIAIALVGCSGKQTTEGTQVEVPTTPDTAPADDPSPQIDAALAEESEVEIGEIV